MASVPTSPFSQASSSLDTLEGLLALVPPPSTLWEAANTLPKGIFLKQSRGFFLCRTEGLEA